MRFDSKACACVLSCFSCVQVFVTPWSAAHQSSLSMEFSRQEYWSGLLCPPSGDLPNPGIEPVSLTSASIGRWVLYHQHHLRPTLLCCPWPCGGGFLTCLLPRTLEFRNRVASQWSGLGGWDAAGNRLGGQLAEPDTYTKAVGVGC